MFIYLFNYLLSKYFHILISFLNLLYIIFLFILINYLNKLFYNFINFNIIKFI